MFMNKRLFLLALPICFASFIACNKSPDAKKDPAAAAAPADPKVSEQNTDIPDNLNKIWYYTNPDVKGLNYSILQFTSGKDDQGNVVVALNQSNYGAYSAKLGENLLKHPSLKLNIAMERTASFTITPTACTADGTTYGITGDAIPVATGTKGLAAATPAAGTADAASGSSSSPTTTTSQTPAAPAAASAQKHQVIPHQDACTAAAITLSADQKLVLKDPKNDQITYQFVAIDKSKLDDLHRQAQQEASFLAPGVDDLKKQLLPITLFAQSKVLYTYANKDGKRDVSVADEKVDVSSTDNVQLNSLTWDNDVTKAKANGVIDTSIVLTASKAPELGTVVEITYQTGANETKTLAKAKLFRVADKVYVLRTANMDKDGFGTIEDTILGLTKDASNSAVPVPASGNK